MFAKLEHKVGCCDIGVRYLGLRGGRWMILPTGLTLITIYYTTHSLDGVFISIKDFINIAHLIGTIN